MVQGQTQLKLHKTLIMDTLSHRYSSLRSWLQGITIHLRQISLFWTGTFHLKRECYVYMYQRPRCAFPEASLCSVTAGCWWEYLNAAADVKDCCSSLWERTKHAGPITTQGPDAAAGWCLLVGAPWPWECRRGGRSFCLSHPLGAWAAWAEFPDRAQKLFGIQTVLWDTRLFQRRHSIWWKINNLFSTKWKFWLWFRKLHFQKIFECHFPQIFTCHCNRGRSHLHLHHVCGQSVSVYLQRSSFLQLFLC